jgi:hypothetical protein
MELDIASDKMALAEKLADYERISAIFWLILGIIQILTLVLLPIGVWNIFASLSRSKLEKKIRNLDPEVPALYEPMAGLVVFAVLNLLFSALIGALGVVLDFYIRGRILENRRLFSPAYISPSEHVRQKEQKLKHWETLEILGELRKKQVISD